MTKQITLTRGLFALVDDEDYEWLSETNLILPKKQPRLTTGWQGYSSARMPGRISIVRLNLPYITLFLPPVNPLPMVYSRPDEIRKRFAAAQLRPT